LTLFDYALLFLLVCSVVISTLRGLVKEVFSLAGWIASFVLANAYGEDMARMLPDSVPGASAKLIVGFVVVFLAAMLASKLLAAMMEAIVKASGLTVADRGLGGLFGLGRGLVIALAVVLLCGMTSIPQQPFWKKALFSPLAETAARTSLPWLPGGLTRHIRF
jgi:membrane protein required for colicin V production